jgi:hypothetical protein
MPTFRRGSTWHPSQTGQVPHGSAILGALSDLLSTPLGSAALSSELKAYVRHENKVFATDVKIPPSLQAHADKVGLVSNPHADKHPHPFHKALGAKMHDLAHLAFKGSDYTLLSRKPGSDSLYTDAFSVVNLVLTLKDFVRYPSGIFAAPVVRTQKAVMSDVLQMLNPADISSLFERSPDLQHLLCTAVISPEGVRNDPAYFPEIYKRFKIFGTSSHFYVPEGHIGGAYVEPDTASLWLTTSLIHCRGFNLHVSVLETYYAHHLIMISREAGLPDTARIFDTDSWVTVPAAYMPGCSAEQRRVRQGLINSMLGFADRYVPSALPDYHAKAQQYQLAHGQKHSLRELRAAAICAHRTASASKMTPSFLGYLWLLLVAIYNLLFNPVHLYLSLVAGQGFLDFVDDEPLVVQCETINADAWTPSEWTNCAILRPVHLLHPDVITPLGVFSTFNFLVFFWVLPKALAVHLMERLLSVRTFTELWHFVQFWYKAVEVTPERIFIVLFFIWLNNFGYLTINLPIMTNVRSLFTITYNRFWYHLGFPHVPQYTLFHLLALAYGVGGMSLTNYPGHHLYYQIFLFWYGLSSVAPSLYDSYYWRPGNVHHTAHEILIRINNDGLPTRIPILYTVLAWINLAFLLCSLVAQYYALDGSYFAAWGDGIIRWTLKVKLPRREHANRTVDLCLYLPRHLVWCAWRLLMLPLVLLALSAIAQFILLISFLQSFMRVQTRPMLLPLHTGVTPPPSYGTIQAESGRA